MVDRANNAGKIERLTVDRDRRAKVAMTAVTVALTVTFLVALLPIDNLSIERPVRRLFASSAWFWTWRAAVALLCLFVVLHVARRSR